MKRDVFVGTWRLVSFQSTSAEGETVFPLGRNATGYLIYTATGHIAVVLSKANRSPFETDDLRSATAAEKINAYDTYFSYFGVFEVHDDRVIHRIEHSLFPNWIGLEQERFFQFDGDQLVLRTPPIHTDGQAMTSELVWERVEADLPHDGV